MSTNRRKKFADYSAQLEAMADGMKKHKGEANFPTQILKESEVRSLRKDLEALRETYEKLETEARLAHSQYMEKLSEAKETLTSLKMMLKATYGKKNLVLADFGVSPDKVRKKKKKEDKKSEETSQ